MSPRAGQSVPNGVCAPGFKGFPIQFSGYTGLTSIADYIRPKYELELQFSPTEIPMTFTAGSFKPDSNDTFVLSGVQYKVKTILFAEASQKGLSTTDDADGEFQIWGYSETPNTQAYNLAVLSIPVRRGTQASDAGSAIVNALTKQPVKLEKCIPRSPTTRVILYSTCIETNTPRTLTINMAYWTQGAFIAQEQAIKLVSVLKTPKNAVPPILDLSTFQTAPRLLSAYSGVDATKNRYLSPEYNWTAPVLNQTGTTMIWTKNAPPTNIYLLLPYSISTSITSVSSEFKNGIRIIEGFDYPETFDKRSTQGYKCMTINPETDIKDGRILVDVETGQRLDQTLAAQDLQISKAAKGSVPAASSQSAVNETVAIVVGVIVGLAILAGIVFGIQYLMTEKPSLNPVQATAVAAGVAELSPGVSAGLFAKLGAAAMSTKTWVILLSIVITIGILVGIVYRLK
jgi:hypothetical protein